MIRRAFGLSVLVIVASFHPATGAPRETASVSGVVRAASGALVAGAEVALLDGLRLPMRSAVTGPDGRFTFAEVPSGRLILSVAAPGFERVERVIVAGPEAAAASEIVVELGASSMTEHVVVSATPGVPQESGETSQAVNAVNEEELSLRAKTVLAQAAAEEPGLHVQRTSPTIGAIFVRGFTGAKVNAFVDGIRYSNGAARGGINTFFDLIAPEYLEGLEVLRGPSSAQYGSDAIGGSVQMMTRAPDLPASGTEMDGRFSAQAGSADESVGASLSGSYATRTFGLIGTLSSRRVDDLRPGEGIDSHNAVTRFFDLPSDVIIDDRLPDTSFDQYGGSLRFTWRPVDGSQVTGALLHGEQQHGQRYDQLLGGDGNLIAELNDVSADLVYVKYDRILSGWLDRLTVGTSYNTQREERVNQGGNGNPNASINHEPERTSAYGVQGLVTKFTARQAISFGADAYYENAAAPSFSENPTTGATAVRRGRIPDGATFRQAGVYVQDTIEAVPGRFQVDGSLRFGGARYEAESSDSPLVNGEPLWPDDDLDVSSVTYRLGGVGTVGGGVRVFGSVSSGFRAPSITDLGTLGLTGAGFEVAAPDVEGRGATVGTTADANAVSTGDPVRQLDPETSVSFEAGFHLRRGRVTTELRGSLTNVDDNIAKQTLILPQGAVGQMLGDETITSQNANGAVFVAASPNPVLVRANFDRAQVIGVEFTLAIDLAANWHLSTNATSLRAEDRDTGLPPNIEGGTPPQEAYLMLRYAPKGRPFWIEPYVHLAAKQDRLSSLDLSDRRTGASRSQSSIAAFFNNGARVRGLIGAGADLTTGTGDDVLIPTGETLSQVQTRVLGPSLAANSLYTNVPGYSVFGIRGGVHFGDSEILVDLENLTDENYRGPSWGIDAPGRGLYVRYATRF
ncbi:MAG TPA: TonB-dependent receptor [Candidatus Cryosericum sp.]|nr:TonB-dependent receptor [Candidatus Cryosericum sp.]